MHTQHCAPHCMVGFLAGRYADAAGAMAPQEAVRRFLDQLDAMFGTPEQPRPASTSYATSQVGVFRD